MQRRLSSLHCLSLLVIACGLMSIFIEKALRIPSDLIFLHSLRPRVSAGFSESRSPFASSPTRGFHNPAGAWGKTIRRLPRKLKTKPAAQAKDLAGHGAVPAKRSPVVIPRVQHPHDAHHQDVDGNFRHGAPQGCPAQRNCNRSLDPLNFTDETKRRISRNGKHEGASLMKSGHLQILTEFAEKVRSEYPEAVVLAFGSCVRGTATEESDLDVCVILNEVGPEDRFAISDMAWEVGFERDLLISTVVICKDDYEKGLLSVSPLVEAIRSEGVAAPPFRSSAGCRLWRHVRAFRRSVQAGRGASQRVCSMHSRSF